MFTQTKIQKQLQEYPEGKRPSPPKNSGQIPSKVQGDPQDYEVLRKLDEIFDLDHQQLSAYKKAILLKDATTLSSPEKEVIKIAQELNLFDSNSLYKIYEDGKEGFLTAEIDAKVKLLQIRLQEDGKYDGPISGIFDQKSADGLGRLLSENDLFKDVEKLANEFEKARSTVNESHLDNFQSPFIERKPKGHNK